MVHIGESPMSIPEMLKHLQPGDCITHCFKGGGERILDPDGRLFWSHGLVRVTWSCGYTPITGREHYFAALPEEERQTMQKSIDRLGEKLQTQIEALPRFQREHRERVKTLDREVMEHAVRLLLDGMTLEQWTAIVSEATAALYD